MIQRFHILLAVLVLFGLSSCRKEVAEPTEQAPRVFDFRPDYAVPVDGGFFMAGWRANNVYEQFAGNTLTLVDDNGNKLWEKSDADLLESLGFNKENTMRYDHELKITYLDGLPTVVGIYTALDTFINRRTYLAGDSLPYSIPYRVDHHSYLYTVQFNEQGVQTMSAISEITDEINLTWYSLDGLRPRIDDEGMGVMINLYYSASFYTRLINGVWEDLDTVIYDGWTSFDIYDFESKNGLNYIAFDEPYFYEPVLACIDPKTNEEQWSRALQCDGPNCLIGYDEFIEAMDVYRIGDNIALNYMYSDFQFGTGYSTGLAEFDETGNLIKNYRIGLEPQFYYLFYSSINESNRLIAAGLVGTNSDQSNRPSIFIIEDEEVKTLTPYKLNQGAFIAGIKEISDGEYLVLLDKYRSENNWNNTEAVVTRISLNE